MKPFISISLALLLTTAAVAEDGASSFVKVTGGSIRGIIARTDGGVIAYKGIPYAAPPVGKLRWQPPADVIPWTGTRDATNFGADCPQAGYAKDSLFYREPMPQSEDCLFLNVWTAAKPAEKRPVMVWIHGGAFTRGSGATPTYDGANFARKGVVLVTINYRLGAFGFLAHPELSAESPHHASGNYGVLDQIAALQWVKNNIAAFGGDPKNVTIFGESAGSWSVCSLMATPLSKGLFHRAIGESGGVFGPMAYLKDTKYGQEPGESTGKRFAAALGASDLAAMRTVPAEKIVEAFFGAPAGPQGFASRGIVDGWVFPKEARLIFAAGEQAHVPVIVGSNANEMTSLTPRGIVPTTLDALTGYVGREYKGLEAEFAQVYPAAADTDAGEAFLASTRDRSFT
jgi:para-nitrobenzyl esterase